MLRIIREEEPPKPSTRLRIVVGTLRVPMAVTAHGVCLRTLASIAAVRSTEPAKLTQAGPRRARLDRDEGAGEGPQPPLRDGQRAGDGHAALPARRAGAGLSAVGGVSVPQVRPAEQDWAGRGRVGSVFPGADCDRLAGGRSSARPDEYATHHQEPGTDEGPSGGRRPTLPGRPGPRPKALESPPGAAVRRAGVPERSGVAPAVAGDL